MKISFVNSLAVKDDAISAQIYKEILWLKDAGHDVHLFAFMCDFDDVDFTRVQKPMVHFST